MAHGLALIDRAVPLAIPEPPVLVQDTVESAAGKIVAKHLGRLRAHDPGTRLGENPEALHNLRVAVRRLRAVIRALAPGFPAPARQHLIAELQWLGQITGGVRDLDVQLARLEQYRMALPVGHRTGLTSLRTYMESERTRLRTALLAGLDSRRYFQLLVRLEAFAFARLTYTPSAARCGRAGTDRASRRTRHQACLAAAAETRRKDQGGANPRGSARAAHPCQTATLSARIPARVDGQARAAPGETSGRAAGPAGRLPRRGGHGGVRPPVRRKEPERS